MTEMSPSGGWLSPSGFRLISLKVLNSVVLLGKSCQYVRGAKMEEKLFDPPPSSTPGKPSSKSQSKRKPSQGRSGSSRRFSASFSEELGDRLPSERKSVASLFGKYCQDLISLCLVVIFNVSVQI